MPSETRYRTASTMKLVGPTALQLNSYFTRKPPVPVAESAVVRQDGRQKLDLRFIQTCQKDLSRRPLFGSS